MLPHLECHMHHAHLRWGPQSTDPPCEGLQWLSPNRHVGMTCCATQWSLSTQCAASGRQARSHRRCLQGLQSPPNTRTSQWLSRWGEKKGTLTLVEMRGGGKHVVGHHVAFTLYHKQECSDCLPWLEWAEVGQIHTAEGAQYGRALWDYIVRTPNYICASAYLMWIFPAVPVLSIRDAVLTKKKTVIEGLTSQIIPVSPTRVNLGIAWPRIPEDTIPIE